MAAFPELPGELRQVFPNSFWNWWQALRTWLLTLQNRLDIIDGGTLAVYANNAAALAGGLVAGDLYRTGGDPDLVCVVH